VTAQGHIRRVRLTDAEAIAAIYRPYVLESRATFEIDPPSAQDIAGRIAKVEGRYPWLVSTDEQGAVTGYAYAMAFRERPAYRFAVETSIYMAASTHRRGTGATLYGLLLDILTAQGFVHAIGALTLPNPGSVALHRRMGFVETGVYPDVGYKLGQWASVGLFQRSLNPLADHPLEPLLLRDAPVWAGILD
jgi:L-amino acid N-acyltransferase YncA